MKKFLTPEMGINALVTLGVVMVGLAVHDKYVRPRMNASATNGGNGGGANGTASPSAPAETADEEA